MSLGREARQHLRAHRLGVLSTLSRALKGYPFGSVVPYVLDAAGCPVILASRLAEHTKNFTADRRVSLLVHEAGPDPQEEARVTLLGRIAPLAQEQEDTARGRYLRYFPHARDYLQLNFAFFRIEPVSLRVIAGFAKAHWVSREAYAPPAGDLAVQEEVAVARLNSLHAPALRGLRADRCTSSLHSEIVGLDCDGFDVRTGADMLRFDFDHCVAGALEACAAVHGVMRSARWR